MKDAAELTEEMNATTPDQGSGYRVLARKYRPATFDDLIGQEAMVRTVSNAFEAGRIPQAWILTGVRGVGKTTTARILARALNYELPNGSVKGPTIAMPKLGVHCQAIMESRHLDVIEMDAASHNGVDDVRQINDAIRYAPVNARYKVYILDEVHMLSPAAFNALLKTLEEPPPHAKFIFATTEIRKVPVTVLSRCQRFDLRRVDADVLVKHLQSIAKNEKIKVETDALALIARAAEGSVRDSLSLFDQAIAHAAGTVRGEDVRQMLGLADRTRTIDLFEAVMRGDAAGAMKELRAQYDIGADPAVALSDLAEFTHFVTRVKVVPAVADDVSFAESERLRGRALRREALDAGAGARLADAAQGHHRGRGIRPAAGGGRDGAGAARLCRRPADARRGDPLARRQWLGAGAARLRQWRRGVVRRRRASAAPRFEGTRSDAPRGAPRAALATAQPMGAALAAPAEAQNQVLVVDSFEELLALAVQKRDLSVKAALERDVRLVRCEDGRLDVALEPSAVKTLVGDLANKFSQWTGRRWVVVVSRETAQPTVKSVLDAKHAELKTGVQADPLVQAVMTRFPGAKIVDVRAPDQMPALPSGDPDEMPLEPPPADEDSYGADWIRDDNPED